MNFEIGIGFSQDLNQEKAAKQAAIAARKGLKGQKPYLTLVFNTVHYSPETILPLIRQSFLEAKILGCSTAGVIINSQVETRGIGILTLSIPLLRVGTACIENLSEQNIETAGKILAKKTLDDYGAQRRQLFMCFTAGHHKNNSELLKGIRDVLGNIFPILGAGSCDDFHFQNTFQIYEDSVLKDGACAFLIGSPHLTLSIASRHGWQAAGKPRIITSSVANIINTIDGQKAVSIYENFLGEESEKIRERIGNTAILYPLGLYSEETNEYLIRNPVDILDDGSIVCQGDVPEGYEVHIMIGNKKVCKRAVEEAATQSRKNLLGTHPKLVLIIESMARLKLFGRAAEEEIKIIQNVFGHSVPVFGFYTDGEICPAETEEGIKGTHLQNESIVIMTIG